ncbi:MAG: polysaccharide biosynthesis/export family protein [Gemmatimonadales bacterium]|nr:polysaccharide biosynthesis/export family protein [Gemmatimonadales bacterium]
MLAGIGIGTTQGSAQGPGGPPVAPPAPPQGGIQAQTTRAQLEAAIADAETILSSPGYSGRIKDAKRREIALLRGRLTDGDLRPGDRVIISVQGEPTLSDSFTVSPNRTILLPAVGEISVRGVLRSETENHVKTEIQKYLRNPVVHVQTTVRLSFLGQVTRPGFYQIAPDVMLGDAIMAAGGPNQGSDPTKSRVERAGKEIVTREGFAQALTAGKTIDQLSLAAGDEILIGGSRTVRVGGSGFFSVILPVITAALSLGYLAGQVF